MPIPDVHRVMDLLAAGQPRAARPLAEALVRHAPGYVTAHVLLARVCEAEHQWGEALTAWQQAYVFMPNSPVINNGLRHVMEHIWDEKGTARTEAHIEADTSAAPPETPEDTARDAIASSLLADADVMPEAVAEEDDEADELASFTQKPARYIEDDVVAPFYQHEAQPPDSFAPLEPEDDRFLDSESRSGGFDEATPDVAEDAMAAAQDTAARAAALLGASEEEDDEADGAEEAMDETASLVPWEDDSDRETAPLAPASVTLEKLDPDPADALVPWEDELPAPVDVTLTEIETEPWEDAADLEAAPFDAEWEAEKDAPEKEKPEPPDDEVLYDSKGRPIDDDIFSEIEQLIDARLEAEGVRIEEEENTSPAAAPEAEPETLFFADDDEDDQHFVGDGAKHFRDTFLPRVEGSEDLDHLIEELETARIVPTPELDDIPAPDLEDEIEDMVSVTLARIYASQKQYEEAARVYEQLAIQQPDESLSFLQRAAEMRSLATGDA